MVARRGRDGVARRGAGRLIALVLCAALGAAVLGADRPAAVAATTVEPLPAPPAPVWTVPPSPAAVPVAPPVRVRIPAIGVDSAIVDIGVDGAGVLVPPGTTDVTGWFAAGPAPGAVGPALLAGHVDSRAGPGVFFRLVELRPGAEVTVDRADGTSVVFVVAAVTRVAKVAFPTDLVYSPLPVPALRLITCGGTFDRAVRSYRDNIIVDATIE